MFTIDAGRVPICATLAIYRRASYEKTRSLNTVYINYNCARANDRTLFTEDP